MRKILLAACVSVVFISPARAVYIGNYSQWRQLSAGQKSGYVMGVFDGHLVTSQIGVEYEAANASGIATCATKLQLTSDMLVQMVDTHYAQNMNSWAQPPIAILSIGLFQMCKTYINAFRSAKGLELLK